MANQTYNQNCLEGIREIPSNSIHLIVTDPPYFSGLNANGQKGVFTDLSQAEPFYRLLFLEFERVLVEGGEVFSFCDWRSYAFFQPIFAQCLPMKNMVVWDKGFGRVNHCFNSSHELLLFGVKGKQKRKYMEKNIIQGINGFSGRKKETEHDTEKPLELIEYLIKAHSQKGDTVLDAFVGSGTTPIACKNLERNFIGYELSAVNLEIIRKRFLSKKEILCLDLEGENGKTNISTKSNKAPTLTGLGTMQDFF